MIYAIDASESSSGKPMERMCAFVRARSDASTVIFFDVCVIGQTTAAELSAETVPVGGSTDVQCIFNWVRDNAPGEKVTVLSDGYFYFDHIHTHGIAADLYMPADWCHPDVPNNIFDAVRTF